MIDAINKVVRASRRILHEIGREPTPEELAGGGIHALATETGLEIGEFRKIVHMVQKGEREARQGRRWWRRTCAS